NLLIFQVSCPNDGDIGKCGIAYPFFLSVENPFIPFSFAGGGQSSGSTGSHFRFSKPKSTQNFHFLHSGKPFLLLLLGATDVNGTHGQPTLNAKKSGDGRIYPGHFHSKEPFQ